MSRYLDKTGVQYSHLYE